MTKYIIKRGYILATVESCYIITDYKDGYAYGYVCDYDVDCDDFTIVDPDDGPLRFTKNDIHSMVKQDTNIDFDMIYFDNYDNLIGGH